MHRLLAINDTVPISAWHGRALHSTEFPSVITVTKKHMVFIFWNCHLVTAASN